MVEQEELRNFPQPEPYFNMRTLAVEPLTVAEFLEFGCCRDILAPNCEKLGARPIEFFRDMIPQTLGQNTVVSYSNCRIESRELSIDVSECHSFTAEMLLPLDADVLMHFGPATHPADGFPLERIRVFRVPKGTMVVIKPGTWHHAPFSLDGRPANILVALPERTYANDCTVVSLKEADRIQIRL